jgi:hypothetical protein
LIVAQVGTFTETLPGQALLSDLITAAGSGQLSCPELNIFRFFFYFQWGTHDFCALLTVKPTNQNLEKDDLTFSSSALKN